jgi:hypothetical protein
MSELENRELTKRRTYTDTDHRAAVLEYLLKGNQAAVSRSLDIPEPTLCDWRKTDWWDELAEEVRIQKKDQIEGELTQIVEKANRETIDRLENGDVYVYQGKAMRAPMKGKDSATVGAIAFDKLRLSLNLPTSITAKSTDMRALANEFRKLSQELNETRVISIPGESEEIE